MNSRKDASELARYLVFVEQCDTVTDAQIKKAIASTECYSYLIHELGQPAGQSFLNRVRSDVVYWRSIRTLGSFCTQVEGAE